MTTHRKALDRTAVLCRTDRAAATASAVGFQGFVELVVVGIDRHLVDASVDLAAEALVVGVGVPAAAAAVEEELVVVTVYALVAVVVEDPAAAVKRLAAAGLAVDNPAALVVYRGRLATHRAFVAAAAAVAAAARNPSVAAVVAGTFVVAAVAAVVVEVKTRLALELHRRHRYEDRRQQQRWGMRIREDFHPNRGGDRPPGSAAWDPHSHYGTAFGLGCHRDSNLDSGSSRRSLLAFPIHPAMQQSRCVVAAAAAAAAGVVVESILGQRSKMAVHPVAVVVGPRMLLVKDPMTSLLAVFLAGVAVAAVVTTLTHRSPACWRPHPRRQMRTTNPPLGLRIRTPKPFRVLLWLPRRCSRPALVGSVPQLRWPGTQKNLLTRPHVDVDDPSIRRRLALLAVAPAADFPSLHCCSRRRPLRQCPMDSVVVVDPMSWCHPPRCSNTVVPTMDPRARTIPVAAPSEPQVVEKNQLHPMDRLERCHGRRHRHHSGRQSGVPPSCI
jgi:hypothetical protein